MEIIYLKLSQCKKCKVVSINGPIIRSSQVEFDDFYSCSGSSLSMCPTPKPDCVQMYPPHSNGMLIVGPIDIDGLIDMDMVISSVSAQERVTAVAFRSTHEKNMSGVFKMG